MVPRETIPAVDRRLAMASIVLAGAAAAVPMVSASAAPADGGIFIRRLTRARTALGRGTSYRIDTIPPHPDSDVWPKDIRADCSGFVAWCFRLNRYPPQLRGAQLFTDTIYADAALSAGNVFFRRVVAPTPGGIVVFPWYRAEDGRHAGHVALVTGVRGPGDYTIIDCSGSADDVGDAVTERPGQKFELHRAALARSRSAHPDWPAESLRDPIFAALIW